MEDVCRLHKLKQSLSKRLLPAPQDRLEGRVVRGFQMEMFYGYMKWITPDMDVKGKRRENNILHRSWHFLLSEYALRTQEHQSYLPTIG